jgi:hypothetical protein
MHGRKAVQILNTLQELQGVDYTPAELAGMTEDVHDMIEAQYEKRGGEKLSYEI